MGDQFHCHVSRDVLWVLTGLVLNSGSEFLSFLPSPEELQLGKQIPIPPFG